MFKPLNILLLLLVAHSAQAQLIFHEPFDFGPGVQTLGNENGWQAAFDDPSPSVVPLAPRHTQEASPFPASGLAIQPANSKMTSYRRLPESLNGKNVFFSYTMKVFSHTNVTALRFRCNDGTPINIGFLKGAFSLQTNRGLEVGDPVEFKKSYFVVGQLQVSDDGREIGVAARYYNAPEQIDVSPPSTTEEWPLVLTYTYGKAKTWQGVGFLNASANAAFDDLRIGHTWYDVTGRQ